MNDPTQELNRNLAKLISTMQNTAGFKDNGGEFGGATDMDPSSEAEMKNLSKIRKKMLKSDDALVRANGETLKHVAGFNKYFSKSLKERVTIYASIKQEYEKTKDATRAARRLADELEENVDVLNTSVKDYAKASRESHKALHGTQKITQKVNSALKALPAAATAFAKALGTEVYDVVATSAKHGADVTAQQVWQARAMGMEHSKLIAVQSEYRSIMNSSNLSTNEFSDKMMEGSHALVAYTGSLEASAMFRAETLKLYTMAGKAGGGVDEFTNAIDSSMKTMQTMTGMTAEEFSKLNASLIGSSEVQGKMYKMNKSDQTLYIQESLKRREALVGMGMFAEQADKAIQSIAGATGGTAKDRMKNAAKLQASLGAMGMGAQGQEAADIMRKGSRASAGELKRLEEIMVSANKQAGSNAGGSYQAEFVQDHLNSLTPLMGPDSPFVTAVTQSANAQDPDAPGKSDEPTWVTEFKAVFLKFTGIFKGLTEGGLTSAIMGGITSLGLSSLIKLSTKALGKIGGVGWKMLTSAITMLAGSVGLGGVDIGVDGDGKGKGKNKGKPRRGPKVGKGLGSRAAQIAARALPAAGGAIAGAGSVAGAILTSPAVAVAGAGLLGYEIGTIINDQINEKNPELGATIGGTISGIIDQSMEDVASQTFKYWGDALGDIFGKNELKGIAKTADGFKIATDNLEKTAGAVKPIDKTIANLEAVAKTLEKTPEEIKKQKDSKEYSDKVITEGMDKLANLFEGVSKKIDQTNEKLEKQNEQQKEAVDRTVDAIGDKPMQSR